MANYDWLKRQGFDGFKIKVTPIEKEAPQIISEDMQEGEMDSGCMCGDCSQCKEKE